MRQIFIFIFSLLVCLGYEPTDEPIYKPTDEQMRNIIDVLQTPMPEMANKLFDMCKSGEMDCFMPVLAAKRVNSQEILNNIKAASEKLCFARQAISCYARSLVAKDAFKWKQLACDGGYTRACLEISGEYILQNKLFNSFTSLQKACEFNDAQGCELLSQAAMSVINEPEKFADISKYFDQKALTKIFVKSTAKACKMGQKTSCETISKLKQYLNE